MKNLKHKVFVCTMIGLMILGTMSMGLMAYGSKGSQPTTESTQEVFNFSETK